MFLKVLWRRWSIVAVMMILKKMDAINAYMPIDRVSILAKSQEILQ